MRQVSALDIFQGGVAKLWNVPRLPHKLVWSSSPHGNANIAQKYGERQSLLLARGGR